ncbi:fructose-bisphosphate aldolase [Nocardia terpenica]|nr:fructose-bisphosphate aldolase [Nocardia terpenica]MBF6103176.1 fructose-bisphosphate aldolase [Nocardia terpenica]MBF6110635.1 fructose-bisphosphate aldolase [Nocardia terpenica]MBF6116766.1 fructose-bisphosphate aldolase [Nocardia terpenica]
MDRRKSGISRRAMLFAAGASMALDALIEPTRTGMITRTATAYSTGLEQYAKRAELSEQAIVQRYVRTLWARSGTLLGTLVWPSSLLDQSFVRWCYWWQAQLLDCAVDAAYRARTPERIDRAVALAHGIRTRNLTGWTNRYYDDMAWLALALERFDRLLGVRFGDALGDLRTALIHGFDPVVGAVPWRSGDAYYNTAAIGPTGIALARLGEPSRARQLADFLYTRLRDTDSCLIFDGVHEPGDRVNRTALTYCQGVAIGLETELAVRTGELVHHDRAAALVAATEHRLTNAGVITAAAADDSGLFMGILARYLTEAALSLGNTTAARIVHTSARAAWENRAEVHELPLFGMDWTRPVTPARNLSPDLSVQLSGWMLLEAAYRLTAAGL